MEYRRLRKSGLQLSALSLGSWLTFGNQISDQVVDELMGGGLNHLVAFGLRIVIWNNTPQVR